MAYKIKVHEKVSELALIFNKSLQFVRPVCQPSQREQIKTRNTLQIMRGNRHTSLTVVLESSEEQLEAGAETWGSGVVMVVGLAAL